MAAEADDRAWIERETGARVVSLSPISAGASRSSFVVELEGRSALVLRKDTGDGPLTGTDFTLSREAVLYRALGSKAVRMPRLVASRPDALLVEFVAGVATEPGDAYDEFCDALGEVHRIDVRSLDLPGWTRDPAADLESWHAALITRVNRPAPLLHFVSRWLRVNQPSIAHPVLCHGDAGAGNFLHEGPHLTALLDWEMAHVGDPMDDLAWVTIRSVLLRAPITDPDSFAERYRSASDIAVDDHAIRWWRAAVLWRMAISCLAALDHRSGGMDLTPYVMLTPLLSRWLVEAIAGLAEVTLEPTDLSDLQSRAKAPLADDVHDAIGRLLASARPEAFFLVDHIRAVDRLGQAVHSANEHEFTRPATSDDDELRRFARLTDRELALWPMLAASIVGAFPSFG